jgi:NadR type nicotinamide-nucleotide adenylyltransferase
MIYRICITGTESTGKSTLAEKLSIHYRTVYVPDYSRYYIDQLSHKYGKMDVLAIAHGIIEQEDRMIKNASKILFSDNDLVNIKIWMQYYKWEVPTWLEEEIIKRKSDLYLLCNIDLPWVADPQRSNPNDRDDLFNRFNNELEKMNSNFKIVSEIGPEKRVCSAIQQIDILLKSAVAEASKLA